MKLGPLDVTITIVLFRTPTEPKKKYHDAETKIHMKEW